MEEIVYAYFYYLFQAAFCSLNNVIYCDYKYYNQFWSKH